MADTETFQKILQIRERDKNQAKKSYQQSVQSSEHIASQLYSLLKNKEEAEVKYHQQLHAKSSVTTLSNFHQYLQKIKAKVRNLEMSVNKARQEMNQKQSQLTEAHIEVKKIEKMLEQKKSLAIQKEKYEENKFLDEITVTQFLNNKR